MHYYHYSHVRPRSKVVFGAGTRMAPNISFSNGSRISVGELCHLGERCYIWAGDTSGEIKIGNRVSLAPNVFITASDYRFEEGKPFREQDKNERSVKIGSDVWLGTGVIVTAGVSIGDGCIVGAGAVVTRDLPANSIAVGVPARVVGQRTRGASNGADHS
ncbi:MAG: acyltransferase [Pseudomonadota bacterium]